MSLILLFIHKSFDYFIVNKNKRKRKCNSLGERVTRWIIPLLRNQSNNNDTKIKRRRKKRKGNSRPMGKWKKNLPKKRMGPFIEGWKVPFVFDTFFLKASISDVDPNLRRQLLCSINFNTDPGKHERGFGISLLLHIKWLTYSTSNPSYNIGWPEVEPELREPYPHRDALQEVFTDIQSSFPFFQDENPTTNKPRSAFEHFGAIFPQQELKEEKAIHLWNDLKSPSGFPDLREVFIEIFERRASPNK